MADDNDDNDGPRKDAAVLWQFRTHSAVKQRVRVQAAFENITLSKFCLRAILKELERVEHFRRT